MAILQAKELLKNPDASLEELAKALQSLGMEYGHIAASAGHGFRQNAEPDLIRLIVLMDALIHRIRSFYD